MKVGIWGSCVTRDAFGIRSHPFDTIDYFARTSWIAQASPPAELEVEVGPALAGKFGERMVREDLGRLVLDTLVAGEPDVVVMDLVDERFEVVDAGDGAWVTESDYFATTPMSAALRKRKARRLRRFDPGREDLFAAATRILRPRLAALPPSVPVLLHSAWYTPVPADAGAQFYASAPREAVRTNRQLALLGTSVARALGPRARVFSAPPERLRADPGHRWGLAMYHYVPAYYLDLLDVLEALAAGDEHPLALASGAPLVPPAEIESLVAG